MFGVDDSRGEFVRQLQEERRQADENAKQTNASFARGCQTRHVLRHSLIVTIDALLEEWTNSKNLPPANAAFKAIRQFIIVYDQKKDVERLTSVARYVTSACESDTLSTSFIGVALGKSMLPVWLALVQRIVRIVLSILSTLPMQTVAHTKSGASIIRLLLTLTSTTTWQLFVKNKQLEPMKASMNTICVSVAEFAFKNDLHECIAHHLRVSLCQSTVAIKADSLHACLIVVMRPVSNAKFNKIHTTSLIVHILTIPALVLRMQTLAPNSMSWLTNNNVFTRSLDLLADVSVQQSTPINCATAMCLLANVIHMADLNKTLLLEHLLDFTAVVTWLLAVCSGSKGKKRATNASQWNAVLGWTSVKIDANMQHAQPLITRQLGRLWSRAMLECLFRQLVTCAQLHQATSPSGAPTSTSSKKTFNVDGSDVSGSVRALLRKLMDKPPSFLQAQSSTTRNKQRAETTLIALVCSLYQSALTTFTQLANDILMGLCRDDFLLPHIWTFISSMGANNGLDAFIALLAENPSITRPEFHILSLFADTNATLLTILDEKEVYEDQKPFTLNQLTDMARFGNQFIVKSLWNELIINPSSQPLFGSILNMTLVLYNLDSRRRFTPVDNSVWLGTDTIKPSTLMTEYSRASKRAVALMSHCPHVVPHKQRVQLFRQCVKNDKVALGHATHDSDDETHYSAPLLTIHRTNMLEDGYRQLGTYSTQQLKGTIRIKFINEQGLEEAGIDQMGVFKEFLEDIIKRVFDPSLSLFLATSEGRLYPSPMSLVQENHLALFEFVGRLLGKAVYEGLVVEVPFAHFFLSNMLARRINAFDELTSLDPQLYKNLTYVKHFDGDVSDLDLTFSYDEDRLGEIVTHDLVPGGRTICVTNDNKISYIHRLASFRLVDQISQQVRAFTSGFRSVVAPAWLSLFAPNELQMLISGASEDVDLADLRKNTHYYGGFHNSHRVVKWLWDVLDKDFNAKERQLFLKFCTSCSKAPLLGFEHLEPAFSIRCVEVADEHDSGDTIGSIVRGFLSMSRKSGVAHSIDRLPTSSTCFNLLKLPNYNKRSVLREKLRYAIHSGTGFELS